jgi:hypothetical protein
MTEAPPLPFVAPEVAVEVGSKRKADDAELQVAEAEGEVEASSRAQHCYKGKGQCRQMRATYPSPIHLPELRAWPRAAHGGLCNALSGRRATNLTLMHLAERACF